MFRIAPQITHLSTKCSKAFLPGRIQLVIRCDQALLRRFATEMSQKPLKESLEKSEEAIKIAKEVLPKLENNTSTQAETISNTVIDAAKESSSQTTSNTSKKQFSTPLKWLSAFSIGFVASGLGSMVGLGGGFIMIPMLTSFFGATQHVAQGTSLAAIVLTGLTSAFTYYQNDAVDLPAALVLTCSAMILSRCSARYTSHFNSKKLKKIFGWFSILISPTVPLKSYLLKKKKEEEMKANETLSSNPSTNTTAAMSTAKSMMNEETSIWKKFMKNSIAVEHWKTMLGTGVFSGAISGFFGVGGGSIITPALCLLTNLSQQKVVGTTLASVVIPSLTGAVTHYKLGHIMMPILIPLMTGTILGGYVGPVIAMKCDQDKLRYLFMIVLMISGIRSIL